MKFTPVCWCVLSLLCFILHLDIAVAVASPSERPNVIVIVSDDLGYGDVGFNGPCDIPTPHLDALAESGVVMEAGYASHPYCSPSRAGLLTGRYQQRFGHECNPGASESDVASGLPLSETLISDVLQRNGYRTAAIGKWHLGDAEEFWPTQRGFDEWFGFSGGGMSYWGMPKKGRPLTGVLRDGRPVGAQMLTHLTDDFSNAAIEFVDRNKRQPFFLYLAYNAPHAPDHATAAHLSKVNHIEYGGRAVYGAMVAGMDTGIGRLVKKLQDLNIRENTLIVFFSDNGGRTTHASNLPLRGHKGMLFEGGIRVPFCVSWPDVLPGGTRYPNPISALDIFPTTMAACSIEPARTMRIDGVDLLPYLKGEKSSRPHQTIYWRYAMGDGQYGYAVRDGDWKLVVSQFKKKSLLFDLGADPGERHDLSLHSPATAKHLRESIGAWDQDNINPLWLDPHGINVVKEESARQAVIDRSLPPRSKSSDRR